MPPAASTSLTTAPVRSPRRFAKSAPNTFVAVMNPPPPANGAAEVSCSSPEVEGETIHDALPESGVLRATVTDDSSPATRSRPSEEGSVARGSPAITRVSAASASPSAAIPRSAPTEASRTRSNAWASVNRRNSAAAEPAKPATATNASETFSAKRTRPRLERRMGSCYQPSDRGRTRLSTNALMAKVTIASRDRSDATANAAENWYSL